MMEEWENAGFSIAVAHPYLDVGFGSVWGPNIS
jgi:hypothetical protein